MATATSGLAVTLTVDATAGTVCSISSGVVSFKAVGSCVIDVNQAGNGDFAAAPQLQQSFAVASEPVVTSFPISRLPSELTSVSGQSPVVTPTPNSSFGIGNTTVNPTTGAITFTVPVGDPGTFSWLVTFQNGKFGVFAASNTKCKKDQVKLNGKCRPAAIVFGKGSQTVAAPGTVTFTVKPSAAGLKALRNASRRKKGLPVTATFTFQSSLGGAPVSHTRPIIVKLSRAGRKDKQKT
jgi:hypothetical protein